MRKTVSELLLLDDGLLIDGRLVTGKTTIEEIANEIAPLFAGETDVDLMTFFNNHLDAKKRGVMHIRQIDGSVFCALNGIYEAGYAKLPTNYFEYAATYDDALLNAAITAVRQSATARELVASGQTVGVSLSWSLTIDRQNIICPVATSISPI